MQTPMPVFAAFAEQREHIAVVGLGYVGLPLAVALARHFSVIGFDISASRVQELQTGNDRTDEVDAATLKASSLRFTSNPSDIAQAKLIIVAVPTPINRHRSPDLTPLEKASETVGRVLQAGSTVVYESTVYPGVTEDCCVPILEKTSGLAYGKDFAVGYSPERINPGDKVHTVDKIVKVVAGNTPETCDLLASVYGAITSAGIHKASSIKVAEAAKVIENTQRDLNIALMNELSHIFDIMGIDTLEVLQAAGTKWNFLPFRPGLVGGHCIGVDPYYLTFKAEEMGYHPEVILAGRRINDTMGKYVAQKIVKLLIACGKNVRDAKVGILGLTFKENVPDLRNTRVVDIKAELEEFGVHVLMHDPMADPDEAMREYGITLCSLDALRGLDAVVLAVPHNDYAQMPIADIRALCAADKPILADVKGAWNIHEAEGCGFLYWRL